MIVATQMLDSMTFQPRPTRAEVSDVSTAIRHGATGVMLSGETASGTYPLETVQTMAKIVKATEDGLDDYDLARPAWLNFAPHEPLLMQVWNWHGKPMRPASSSPPNTVLRLAWCPATDQTFPSGRQRSPSSIAANLLASRVDAVLSKEHSAAQRR